MADDLSQPSACKQIQLLQQQLLDIQAELQNANEQLKKSKQEAAEEANAAINIINDLKVQAQSDIDKCRRCAAEQLALSKFGLERFSADDDSIKFYTGFPTYKHLKIFYEFVKPNAETMVYCYASGARPSRPEIRSMQLIDEMFLFLVRLKLGLFEQDLAHRFQIHMSSVSRKVTTWANYLYFILGGQCIWPSKNEIQNNMPEAFYHLYPTTE